MSLSNDQITANNFKEFYDRLRPYLGIKPAGGFTPIGTVITVMGDEAPEGYLICNGATYDIKDYPELAEFFEDKFGSKNYFGGDGTVTFKVPNMVPPKELSVYCIAVKNLVTEVEPKNRNIPTVTSLTPRWLRFDPDNKKGLVIKAGTIIKLANDRVISYDTDYRFDLSSFISDPGKDYFVFVNDSGNYSCSLTKASGDGVYLGRFHTLCVNAGTMTMIAPDSPNSGRSVGSSYLVKPYKADLDPDFYEFYNKTVTAVSAGTPYDVITMEHPLSGFQAGDILPESVFCLTWFPDCLVDDAMVYDKATDICVDVYLQSGTGANTRSAYNQTHTVNRNARNFLGDLNFVGKRFLALVEFTSVALGSNESISIAGASDKTTVGGHTDSNGRRMISAIGCEECCGYLWQASLVGSPVVGTGWQQVDGKSSFGQSYGKLIFADFGGSWEDNTKSGSRCLATLAEDSAYAHYGSRGCTSISTGNGNMPISTPALMSPNDYSTQERVVGTWIDGKPIYQQVIEFDEALIVFSNTVKYMQKDLGFPVDTVIFQSGYFCLDSVRKAVFGSAECDWNLKPGFSSHFYKDTNGNAGLSVIISQANYSSVTRAVGCAVIQYTKTS